MKNKRFIDIEEVGGKINTSLMRNLTGGGSIEARQLYQNTETFKLSSLLTLEINNAFQLDGKPQQADYRRYLLIDFKTNFTDDPKKIGKSINGIQYRQANHYYETEEFLISIRPAFFHMISDVYCQYYNETQKCLSFTIPDIVRENTNRYLTEQDTVKRLFDYCFVKIEDQTKKMPIARVWEVIKRSDIYLSLPHTDRRIFSRDEVYSYIKELYNIPHNPTSHKPIIVCGIQEIESGPHQDENEENAFDT
jgi:phage/plasmid-associated DNA primase